MRDGSGFHNRVDSVNPRIYELEYTPGSLEEWEDQLLEDERSKT